MGYRIRGTAAQGGKGSRAVSVILVCLVALIFTSSAGGDTQTRSTAIEMWGSFNRFGEELTHELPLPWPDDYLPPGGAPADDSSYPPEGIGTNWDGTQFLPGATVADEREFTPTPWLFTAMNTDYFAPSTAQIESYISYCENQGCFSIQISNFHLENLVTDGSSEAVQMICNHVADYPGPTIDPPPGCFHLYFPPNFDVNAPDPYPILFQGNGWGASNNLVFSKTPYYPVVAYNSWLIDDQGMVCVQWNCGGSESLGLTEVVMGPVADLIDRLAAEFNCNRDQLVCMGSSRGGGVAIQMGKNPHDFDYTSVAVIASSPPLRIGTLSQTPLATCPALCSVYNSLLGDNSACRYDHDPPPMSNPAPLLDPVLMTTSPAEADRLSPDGDDLDRLAGQFVMTQCGTHDVYFRYDSFVGFDVKLSKNEVPHTTIFALYNGHAPGRLAEYDQAFEDFVTAMLLAGPDFDPSTFRPVNLNYGVGIAARNYSKRTNLEDPFDKTVIRAYPAHFPFVATFPYRLGRAVRAEDPEHEPGLVIVCGQKRRTWQVTVMNDSGWALRSWQGGFIESATGDPYAETGVAGWSFEGLPGMGHEDRYSWQFLFSNLDVTWYTNYTVGGERIEAETLVLEDQPWQVQYLFMPGTHICTGVDFWLANSHTSLVTEPLFLPPPLPGDEPETGWESAIPLDGSTIR